MTPDKAEFSAMVHALANGAASKVGPLAEQDFLNHFYADRWKALPYTLNCQKRIKLHHPGIYCFDDVAIEHYVDEKASFFHFYLLGSSKGICYARHVRTCFATANPPLHC
jgi:lipopolysaccharide biosynthesis glycosyltransferase